MDFRREVKCEANSMPDNESVEGKYDHRKHHCYFGILKTAIATDVEHRSLMEGVGRSLLPSEGAAIGAPPPSINSMHCGQTQPSLTNIQLVSVQNSATINAIIEDAQSTQDWR